MVVWRTDTKVTPDIHLLMSMPLCNPLLLTTNGTSDLLLANRLRQSGWAVTLLLRYTV